MKKSHDRDYFYKYVTADVAKNILNTLKVRCSSPVLFNDPFDSQIEIWHNAESKEDFIKKSTKIICNVLQPLLKNRDTEQNHQFVYNEILKDKDFVDQRYVAFEKIYKSVNELICSLLKEDRIFCVSETNDNLLMWAHYTDNHKGAVIKLKCIPEKDTALCVAKPVLYSTNMPLLKVEELFNSPQQISRKILDEILFTKSLDWQHENEWRVILMKQQDGCDFDMRGIFEEELDTIYLGCRISESDKKDIAEIVRTKRKNVRIFCARKNDHEFKLDFEEL
ncbi:MAG: DUF2971 domain-containing protein [Candidatus Omnitrophica bacterium]|nr:DUF2971 domain-containing protein [Candidatus Omnitrophota bacterium]